MYALFYRTRYNGELRNWLFSGFSADEEAIKAFVCNVQAENGGDTVRVFRMNEAEAVSMYFGVQPVYGL